MKLEEFKKNFLAQKDIITGTDLVGSFGGNGTSTSYTTQTEVGPGWARTMITLFGGEQIPDKTDSNGDWEDECCEG
ncbi:MAG: hypothetical protein AAFO69_03575 [Bacteroidota bacterium]